MDGFLRDIHGQFVRISNRQPIGLYPDEPDARRYFVRAGHKRQQRDGPGLQLWLHVSGNLEPTRRRSRLLRPVAVAVAAAGWRSIGSLYVARNARGTGADALGARIALVAFAASAFGRSPA